MGALSPPSRVTPNFIDPPSQRYLSDVTLSVCLVVATSLVSLRVYTKWTIIKSFHNEDCKYLILKVLTLLVIY